MKKSNYYLYTNIDELYGFLVKNAIYPSQKEANALSLAKKGLIYLTKKRFTKDFIYSKCQLGIMSPVILELSIKTSHDKNVIVVSDDELLVSSMIPFNSVIRVYYLEGDLPLTLFDDAYLFRSLLSKEEFEFGEELPSNLENIVECDIDLDIQNKWDKIQGFYASRYGSLRSEFKAGKRLMIASNLDEESAVELLGQSQKEYFSTTFSPYKKFLFKEDSYTPSRISLFINDNYDAILSGKKIKNKDENKELVASLFSACLSFKKGEDLLSVFDLLTSNGISNLEKEYQGDIYGLKSVLFLEENETIRFLFLLNAIVNKGYEEALDYLSNFENLSSIEKKCLMGLYGLSVGLSRLSISIKKKRPDILLFAFNKTKKYFVNYIDSALNTNDFFSLRDFVTDNVTKDGLNYVAYNRDFEMNYLKIRFANKLTSLFSLPKGMIGKDLIKFTTAEELHRTYLLARKGNE